MFDVERKEHVEELAVQAKTDPSVIPELWGMVERLIQVVCRKYCWADNVDRLYGFDDLCQNAYFGFLKAIEAYEPERGAFSSILIYCVRRSCRAELGLRSKRDLLFDASSLHEPLSQHNESDTMLVDALPDPDAEQPFESFTDSLYNGQLRATLDECMLNIPQHQAEALKARYYGGATLEAIGARRGVSRESARQDIDRGLDSMRRPENAARLASYRQRVIDGTYRQSSFRTFKDTWYSCVERAAEILILKGV